MTYLTRDRTYLFNLLDYRGDRADLKGKSLTYLLRDRTYLFNLLDYRGGVKRRGSR
jgi:hypothetical protein